MADERHLIDYPKRPRIIVGAQHAAPLQKIVRSLNGLSMTKAIRNALVQERGIPLPYGKPNFRICYNLSEIRLCSSHFRS